MNVFLDSEFSNLPWFPDSKLLSLGLMLENGKTYYACLDDIDSLELSSFVQQKVLPYLDPPEKRKSQNIISQEIEALFYKEKDLTFWAIFPTLEQLNSFSNNEYSSHELFEKYADWDFQLFQRLWKNLPSKFQLKCKNLTTILEKLPKKLLPENKSAHNALSDAMWNYEVWKIAKENGYI
jgi:hypothetical protein